jgi:multidrug efflux pump
MCQLGIAIMGGLLISQMLTLYTTPVLYLYLDGAGRCFLRMRKRLLAASHDEYAPISMPKYRPRG